MHNTVFVVFKINKNTFKEIERSLSSPVKKYISENEIRVISDLYGAQIKNGVSVDVLRRIYSEKVEEDEKGFYYMSVDDFKHTLIDKLAEKIKKPFSKFQDKGADDLNVKFGNWTAENVFLIKGLLNNKEKMNDIYPEALFTPDCEWIEMEGVSRKKGLDWERFVENSLDKNKDNGIVLVVNYDT